MVFMIIMMITFLRPAENNSVSYSPLSQRWNSRIVWLLHWDACTSIDAHKCSSGILYYHDSDVVPNDSRSLCMDNLVWSCLLQWSNFWSLLDCAYRSFHASIIDYYLLESRAGILYASQLSWSYLSRSFDHIHSTERLWSILQYRVLDRFCKRIDGYGLAKIAAHYNSCK